MKDNKIEIKNIYICQTRHKAVCRCNGHGTEVEKLNIRKRWETNKQTKNFTLYFPYLLIDLERVLCLPGNSSPLKTEWGKMKLALASN